MNDLSLEFQKKVIINVTFESISIYCGFAALKPVLTSNSLQIEAEAEILDCAKSQENDVDAMIINQLDVNDNHWLNLFLSFSSAPSVHPGWLNHPRQLQPPSSSLMP